jgi:hypothetical protein
VFARALSQRFGARAGALGTLLLLACPSVAFYENKFLSASLGVFCNIAALATFVAFSHKPTRRTALLLGLTSGLTLLGRPTMLFALPFTALAAWSVARAYKQPVWPWLGALALGVVLSLAPMAARNLVVTGRPNVFASHGGGIPFYIGNGPQATGRWNDAGGLLSGQVAREQVELAAKLGIHSRGDALDQAVGEALYARAFAFIREQPGAWLKLEARKLRDTLGNHEFVHDFDLLGERELLGWATPVGLPFGVMLGLGVLGLAWLVRKPGEAIAEPDANDDAHGDAAHALRVGMARILAGQLLAVLLANLVWFTASQHRMPLLPVLAFAAAPALDALWTAAATRKLHEYARPAQLCATAFALLLAAQAFWPQPQQSRPSSVHYYNLANAEELLQRYPAALEHYRKAAQRSPKQPMFLLRFARLARLLHHDAEARDTLQRLLAGSDLPAPLRSAAEAEMQALNARVP